MNTETFEHIVSQSGAGRPASIRFFGRITEESAGRFSEAFDFLENIVRIIILESQHLVVLPRVMNVCGTTV